MTRRPTIIAHRGNSSVTPPSTLAAVEAAWRAEADFTEIDIQVTADGDAAVIHDATFDRTTDAVGPIADRTAHELSTIDAGTSFSPVFAGQHVPRLAEVVDLLTTRTELGLVLEIKGDWDSEPLRRALTAVAPLADRLVVESFSVPTMRLARDLAPELRRDLLIGQDLKDVDGLVPLCRELDVRGVGPDGRLLLRHPDLVDQLHAAGMTVNVWTLNEPAQWDLALRAGVDGIVTDRPDRLAGWLIGRGL